MPNNIFRCVGNYYMITLEKLKVQMKRNNIYIYIFLGVWENLLEQFLLQGLQLKGKED